MKNRFKKIAAAMMAVIMVLSLAFPSFAVGTTAKVIKFDENGKLKIMHVTDTHLEAYNLESSVWAIGEACDVEKPDIVMITGDNVDNIGDVAETKRLIDGLMNVFESRDIPVAVTFGNHDSENEKGMTREELMSYYNTFSCSVSVDDGELLSGCGTYNIPVMSSDGRKIKFNLWVFDSGDYDSDGHYGCVQADQVEWYKIKSDMLAAANGGERVNSLVFQHIIVPEVYDALLKTDSEKLFSFKHMYNDEYYMFDPDRENFGTLNETPCCGYLNYGQFDAMVEKGDVLAMFTGHDHTNAFGVKYKGIDIMNSLSTRYNGDSFSTSYGYRIIEVDENDTSVYTTKAVHWYDFFDIGYAVEEKKNGDDYGFKTALDIAFKGFWQKLADTVSRGFATLVTGRQVTYED